MRHSSRFIHPAILSGACAAVALLIGLDAGAAGQPYVKTSPQPACAALGQLSVSALDIGLPTGGAVVTSASLVEAGGANANGEYCLVKGAIHPVDATAPDILFQLNLPTSWNQRSLQLGGGGYNGTVITGLGGITFAPLGRTPLARGYATYGDDSGHAGTSRDAVFALNDEALINYGYAHLKKTHDVAARILTAYYGDSVAYKSYFAGGSTGGREALTVVQRYPADYDGVFAGSPTAVFWGIRMIGFPVGQAVYGAAGGYLNPAKQALVTRRSVAACDLLDGAADGIVSNVAACRALAPQTLAGLRCAGGADLGDQCLSDAQIKVITTLHDDLTLPYPMAYGSTVHRGYNVLEGTDFSNNASTLGMGDSAVLLDPPTSGANGYLYAQAAQWVRYFVARDPHFDALRFDPLNPGAFRQRVVELSSIIGANNPDMTAFQARGGKLIILQGAADSAVSPDANVAYYQQLAAKFGPATLDSFVRFYLVPGMGHGIGTYVPSWDVMAALDAWVSDGTPPGTLSGTDTATATAGRGRPLCVYPGWPRYNGTGDLSLASSFTCVTN